MIVRSAEAIECKVIWSEDLHAGQRFGETKALQILFPILDDHAFSLYLYPDSVPRLIRLCTQAGEPSQSQPHFIPVHVQDAPQGVEMSLSVHVGHATIKVRTG